MPSRGGHQSGYRSDIRGRHGRGGVPNRAAAETEHIVVRGSNHGRNITTTVVQHACGQPDPPPMAGFDHSPKENPPDSGDPNEFEFNPDTAMMEDDGSREPMGVAADGCLRS